MILLIADSGSSKTDWRLYAEGKKVSFTTEGYNPFHMTREEIAESIGTNLLARAGNHRIDQIHFYGAGCADPEKKNIVALALKECFLTAEIFVESDLLGTARALLGNQPGFAGIIGTGSNSCMYDGEKIIQSVSPLGYLLGDEGSGTFIGKSILKRYLRNQFPGELRKRVLEFCGLTNREILDSVYRKSSPQKFLATFALFAEQNIQEEAIIRLMYEAFSAYCIVFVEPYNLSSGSPLNFSGSIAYHFQKQLEEVCTEKGFIVQKIIQSPIDELAKFHLT